MPGQVQRFTRYARLARTLRHIQPRQAANRVLRRFAPTPPIASTAPPRRGPGGPWQGCAGRHQSMLSATRFRFLAREAEIACAEDWNRSDVPRLWLYNLHYFDDLLAREAPAREAWHRAIISRWMAENPPLRGAGWEPYPSSRRLVNWICWALAGNALPAGAEASLMTQARAIRSRLEWHLRGNHLFANAKALVFAGTFFTGHEAEGWLNQGLRLLVDEIDEEILSDGGHFELSPMYHAIVAEDMLDLIQLAELFPQVLKGPSRFQRWHQRAEAMLDWLAAMCHPDGDIALFNDAAFDQARPPKALFRHAERLGLSVRAPEPGILHLASSGFVRLRGGPWVGLFDVGEVGAAYIAGHAHADTLSIELSYCGERLISNGGTSIYEAGAQRDAERSTAAHATVEIDGESSSETWGGFRVGRRAHPIDVRTGSDGAALSATAAHDGYRFLTGRPVHRRTLTITETNVQIRDRIEGAGRHDVVGRLPLHPGNIVHEAPDGWRVETAGGRLDVVVDGPVTCGIETGTFAPAFGVRRARPVMAWRYCGPLPIDVTTKIRIIADT